MSGKDVAELNADLVALGFATGAEIDEHPEYFGAETKAALKALQERLGVKEANGVKLGELALGQAVFLPSTALRITSVSGTLGGGAQQGSPIMQATSTRRQVLVKLDACRAGEHQGGRPRHDHAPQQPDDAGRRELGRQGRQSVVLRRSGGVAAKKKARRRSKCRSRPPTRRRRARSTRRR